MRKGVPGSQLLAAEWLGLTRAKAGTGLGTTDSWRAWLGKAARVPETARPRKVFCQMPGQGYVNGKEA